MSSYSLRTVRAVDSHTEGNPTRVIVGGVPILPGNTLIDRCYQALFTSQKTTTGDYTKRFEGPLGTFFEGRAVHAEERNGVTFVRPRITGYHQFVLDPEDLSEQ